MRLQVTKINVIWRIKRPHRLVTHKIKISHTGEVQINLTKSSISTGYSWRVRWPCRKLHRLKLDFPLALQSDTQQNHSVTHRKKSTWSHQRIMGPVLSVSPDCRRLRGTYGSVTETPHVKQSHEAAVNAAVQSQGLKCVSA